MHCAGALLVAVAWRVSLHQADGAQQGKRGGHGCSGRAAWLATTDGGAGDRGIELCKGRVLAFCHSGIVSGVALILSVYMHSGAGPTQENWQLLSTIGQWLTSQALPFIIGGDFQVEPKQLEDSGWVRTVGGFVVTPQPSHRVTDFFVVSRDLAGVCEAITHVSQHIAPHRPVRIVVSTRLIQPKKRVMSRPKPWPAERPSGCRKREHDLDWDPVRRLVQAAAGAQAGCTSFIDAVEEELVDAFLMALEEADAFRGRSQGQKLVWKRREVCGPSGCCLSSCVFSACFGASRPRCGRPGIQRASSGPRRRVASSGASGSRQHGVNGQRRTGTR